VPPLAACSASQSVDSNSPLADTKENTMMSHAGMRTSSGRLFLSMHIMAKPGGEAEQSTPAAGSTLAAGYSPQDVSTVAARSKLA
jgi:hypothetical protein